MFGGDKLQSALDICKKEKVTLDEIAYIGDDINCKELLSAVGFAFCPADAVNEIKMISEINILTTTGGNGAFREMYEMIVS